MAGRGPAPGANPNRKSSQQRRRRNAPEATFDELPADGFQGPFPPLDADYSARTVEWYEDWARSPMAARFTKVDWNRLRWVIAPLFERHVLEPSKDLAGEIRLQESLLGATVLDRQRLKQRISSDHVADDGPPKMAEVRRLRAVDPHAVAGA